MPELTAVCTPNSYPHEDGRVEHGYQLNVLDDLTVVATVELPHWTSCDLAEAGRHLTEAGFALCPGGEDGGWRPAGLGYMAPVDRLADVG
ncbi:hypothetical protein ACODT3_42250 [Streptomyces sp. 4.24]|uniref:hypothetical protein n=1 Tax=Streptomyces tritrimontium TaxID=3406573 RepID=UPI003BB73433